MLVYSISTNGCAYNANLGLIAEGGAPELKKNANEAARSLMKISALMWLGMHVIGGMIRSMTHIEPYYEKPEDPDEPQWKVLMC
jgi:hypothetical protein